MSQKQIHIAFESLGLSSLWQYFPTETEIAKSCTEFSSAGHPNSLTFLFQIMICVQYINIETTLCAF